MYFRCCMTCTVLKRRKTHQTQTIQRPKQLLNHLTCEHIEIYRPWVEGLNPLVLQQDVFPLTSGSPLQNFSGELRRSVVSGEGHSGGDKFRLVRTLFEHVENKGTNSVRLGINKLKLKTCMCEAKYSFSLILFNWNVIYIIGYWFLRRNITWNECVHV